MLSIDVGELRNKGYIHEHPTVHSVPIIPPVSGGLVGAKNTIKPDRAALQ